MDLFFAPLVRQVCPIYGSIWYVASKTCLHLAECEITQVVPWIRSSFPFTGVASEHPNLSLLGIHVESWSQFGETANESTINSHTGFLCV